MNMGENNAGKFVIGDIVSRKNESEQVYYIVTNRLMRKVRKVSTKEESFVFSYDIMQVVPVVNNPVKTNVIENALILQDNHNSKDYKFFVEFLKTERKIANFHGEPNYITEIKKNMDYSDPLFPKKLMVFSDSKPEVIEVKREDVSYHSMNTIDECLDAYNDLAILHNVFGNDEYLFAKQLAVKQIKEILKEGVM